MNILGIETSCDETAAAVVRDGREVLSNVVYTQIPLHQPYGGVVPEIASRAHIEKISEVVRECLRPLSSCGLHSDSDIRGSGFRIDAVAVTYGPGLSPALIVGLNAAKGVAKGLGVPLMGIHHIEAHLHTPFLDSELNPLEAMPALGLAISGGNTRWVDMSAYGRYEVIGETLDDAAGEAFDKAAKLLGLGYPGGPKVDRISKQYIEEKGLGDLIPFPKGRPRDGVTALAGLPAELCVSFSGLKTSLLRYVQKEKPTEADIPRIVASYQEAIVQAVADRTRTALRRKRYRSLIVGGGVSLNSRIRAVLADVVREAGVELLLAKPKYTGDNGAMIAGLAYYRRNHVEDAMSLDVNPCLEVGG